MTPDAPSWTRLGRSLAVLSSPARLALLATLRAPRALHEIRVPAEREYAGSRTDRALSRQAVRHHLDQLVEEGLVLAREEVRAAGPVVEYTLNHQAIFALMEDFRALARLRPSTEPDAPTRAAPPPPTPAAAESPHLVLVKGLDEGAVFPLPASTHGRDEWVIGRKRGVDVTIDFDPFVSSENSLVVREGDAYFVQDVPGSLNGTARNFETLPRGGRLPLRAGDIIGVGRTLLVFQGRG